MATVDELETRVHILEDQMKYVHREAKTAQILAAAADHDVSENGVMLRAHTKALNALRETQLEHQTENRQRFTVLEQKISALDQKFTVLDEKVSVLDQKFSTLDKKFSALDQRVTGLDQKFVKLDEKFTVLDEKFVKLEQKFVKLEEKFDVGFAQLNLGITQIFNLIQGLSKSNQGDES